MGFDEAAQAFDRIGGTICLNLNGSVTLSIVHNGHRKAKTYFGFSDSEAVRDFMDLINEEEL